MDEAPDLRGFFDSSRGRDSGLQLGGDVANEINLSY